MGRRLGWAEFRSWINGRPPDGYRSALWRARHPRSWWRTPETDFIAGQLFALQVANWQRGGGKGQKPEPVKLPEDRPVSVKSNEELKAKRKAQREHLARRRASRKRR